MKKVAVIGLTFAGTAFLPSCMPAPQTGYAGSYQRDAKVLEEYRQNWYQQKQEQFYLKQVIVQVKAIRKAIAEINKQIEKEKAINEDLASKIYTLEWKVKKLEEEINNFKTSFGNVKQEIELLKKEVNQLNEELKTLKAKNSKKNTRGG